MRSGLHRLVPQALEISILQGGYARGTSWKTAAHLRAPFWRLYWQLETGLTLRYRQQRIALGPEHLVIVAPETDYQRSVGKAVNQVFLHVALRGLTPGTGPGITAIPAPSAALSRLKEITFTDPRFFPSAVAVVGEAIAGLPPAAISHGPIDPLVVEAMQTMAAHDWRGPSASYFAKHFAMHPDAFSRRFRRGAGVSPTQWCLTQRIERSCEHLIGSTDSIETIAELLGFSDRSHFQRAFRKQRGCGPAAFRQAHTVLGPM